MGTGLNYDALKKRRAGSRSGGGWKPREGQNLVRILPPGGQYVDNWGAMQDLAHAFKMHFFRIEGRPTDVSRCLEELKQTCPACDTWRAWRKSEDPGIKELAKQIAPSDQYLFNILDINNLQSGIQVWAANYTCWDKVMEIAANPSWGNVVDPANGVNFDVQLTPGNRSRSGYNSYSVMPEPQRTTVMAILQNIPNWKEELDKIADHIAAAKEPDEIVAILSEMGFPNVSLRGSSATRGAPMAAPMPMAVPNVVPSVAPTMGVPGIAPAAVPTVTPAVGVPGIAPTAAPNVAPAVGVPGVAPAAVPSAAPVPYAVPPAAAPVAAPAPMAPPANAAPATSAQAVHYDPGPLYQPKMPDGSRPAGAPRCFGDYNPQIHRCQECPVMTACQLSMLGIQ